MTIITETQNPIIDWFYSVPENDPIDFGKPYILCNETNKEAVLQAIASKALAAPSATPTEHPLKERVHIGFASQFNYDIMALTKPSYGLICDVNPNMLDYYRKLKECICTSPDRQTFLANILVVISPEDRENFAQERNRPNSWLAQDASYEYIRGMYVADRIRHRCLNAAGDSLQVLARNAPPSAQIDTIYASNIYEWLENEGFEKRDQFRRNMQTLIQPGTSFIDARYLTKEKKDSGPPLRISPKLPDYARELRPQRR